MSNIREGFVRITVDCPNELTALIDNSANANRRTRSGEILIRLERSFGLSSPVGATISVSHSPVWRGGDKEAL